MGFSARLSIRREFAAKLAKVKEPEMKYGFFTTFAPDCTFEEACALAKEVGYDGIQPRIVESNTFDPVPQGVCLAVC